MAPDPGRLERFLGTAGALDTDRPSSDEQLARHLFLRELSREPDDGVLPTLRALLNTEGPDSVVTALRGSMEWFINSLDVLGAQTEAYRRLRAHTLTSGRARGAQLIAECIAAYRLILDRDPDNDGFDYWVDIRERAGLAPMVAGILGSAESTQPADPSDRPPVDVVVLAVASAAIGILNAAATDAVLGVVAALRVSVDQLAVRLDMQGRSLDEFTTLVRMRFDGEAAKR